jgi:hypothetical protein
MQIKITLTYHYTTKWAEISDAVSLATVGMESCPFLWECMLEQTDGEQVGII